MYKIVVSFLLVLQCFSASSIDICSSCHCVPSLTNECQDVDCTRLNFPFIPPVTIWPERTLSLDLSFNNISSIQFEMNYESLQTLKLNNNKIRVMNSSSFGGLNNLKYLDISYNLLTNLNGNEFYGLGRLKVLNISHNKIKTLPELLFYELYDLEELSLSGNPVTHVESAHFARMLNLKKLDMSSTGAYSLPPNLFYTLESLEALDLSANDFHYVPNEALRSVPGLKRLRLNQNPIDKLDKTSFRRLNTLEVLEISFMDDLVSIGPQTFSDLTNLKTLEVKYNHRLVSVDKNAFSGLFNKSGGATPTLHEISLEMNRLDSLDSKVFDCNVIPKLNLQRNPWNCDCRIKWIVDCPIATVYTADLMCDSPSPLRNRKMFETEPEDLECDHLRGPSVAEIHHDRVIRLTSLVLGCAVLIVLALGIIVFLKWKSIKYWWRLKKRGPGPVYYVPTKTYAPESG